MPWASTDYEKATDHLNYAWNEVVQALGANAYPGYLNFGATLSPAEFSANQPRPVNFTVAQITAKMNAITSEYKIGVIQGILADLDSIRTNRKATLNSQNYRLKRADVLEWQVDGASSKTEGFDQLKAEKIEELRYHLSLPPTPQPTSGGNLSRS